MKNECFALRSIRIGADLVRPGDPVKADEDLQADLVARGWAEIRAVESSPAKPSVAKAATGDKE